MDLTPLGLESDDTDVYELVLARPSVSAEELAADTHFDESAAAARLRRLHNFGLIQPSQESEDRWRVVSPGVGLEHLAAKRLTAARTQAAHVEAIRAIIPEIALRSHAARGEVDDSVVEDLHGRDAVVTRLNELHAAADEATWTMVTNIPTEIALEQARQADAALLARGVRIRGIYPEAIRRDPAAMRYLEWMASQGAEVRVVATLPIRMVIVDRRAALIARDPENVPAGAVVVRNRGLLTAVTELWATIWERGRDVFDSAPDPDASRRAARGDLLRLLNRGLTDEAIAQHMNISVRTVRRMVRELNAELGVTSRYQLGHRVAQLRLDTDRQPQGIRPRADGPDGSAKLSHRAR